MLERAQDAGVFQGFVKKPLGFGALLTTIGDVLPGAELSAEFVQVS